MSELNSPFEGFIEVFPPLSSGNDSACSSKECASISVLPNRVYKELPIAEGGIPRMVSLGDYDW